MLFSCNRLNTMTCIKGLSSNLQIAYPHVLHEDLPSEVGNRFWTMTWFGVTVSLSIFKLREVYALQGQA